MSDIRFNQWLHQSGTGGVSQSDGGHVGIGTTNPLIPVGAGNTHILNVGVVTCNNISAGSSITAGTFYGSGANLTGLAGGGTGLDLNDNVKLRLGTGNDLEIYHTGTRAIIKNNTGETDLFGDDIRFFSGDGNEIFAIFNDDGAVELYHNNSKKLETQTNGTRIYDSLGIGTDSTSDAFLSIRTPNGTSGSPSTKGGVIIRDGSYANGKLIDFQNSVGFSDISVDGSLNMNFANNHKLQLGDSQEIKLYHDGTHSRITNSTGFLALQSDSFRLYNAAGSENMIDGTANGSVNLYYDNSKKFETDSAGTTTSGRAYITGTILQGTTVSGEANGDEATFANTGGNAGITIRSAVNAETKIYFSEGTSGGSQYRGTINYNHNTNYMAFSANEYERMRITSDGTLQLYYYNQNTGRGRINFGSSAPAFIEGYDTGNAGSGAYLKFGTNGTDRMRIDNSGHTFFSGMSSLSASGSNKGINMENSTNNGRMNIHANSSAGNALGISFYNNGANVGTIYYGTSSTAYNTTSDYRLKENATTISDSITRLKSLKPYRFNFKVDPDKTVDGFFAHEVAPIIPEAVTGEKDAEDMQQLDYAKLTPLLTAALQEAITKIETLEAKVASLEGS